MSCCLAGACTKEPTDESSSSSSGEDPTTGDATSTGNVPTTGGSSESTAGSSTGEPVAEDALCATLSAHFVECFPDGPTVAEVEAVCHDDLDSSRTDGEACFEALAAYYTCQSITPCEVYEDSCLDEANARINICGG